jgi:hypothetical protein
MRHTGKAMEKLIRNRTIQSKKKNLPEGVSFISISVPSTVLSGDGGEGLSPDVGAGLSADCNVGLLQSVVDTVVGGLCPLDTGEPCPCAPNRL